MDKKYLKLTFDLDFEDHQIAFDEIKKHKHTTQYIVDLICQSLKVTDKLPTSNLKTTSNDTNNQEVANKLPTSNFDDIPKEFMNFLK